MLDGKQYFGHFPDRPRPGAAVPAQSQSSWKRCAHSKRSCGPTFPPPRRPGRTRTTPRPERRPPGPTCASSLNIRTLSLAERDRRWAAVRNEMRARHLECLVLCGWPTMWDFNIANARYLCPIGGNAEFNVLVFPAAGEPTSFIYSPVFTEYWRGAQSWVADVRPRRRTFADSVADRLTELGFTGARVLASTDLRAPSILTDGCRTACISASRNGCPASSSSVSTT